MKQTDDNFEIQVNNLLKLGLETPPSDEFSDDVMKKIQTYEHNKGKINIYLLFAWLFVLATVFLIPGAISRIPEFISVGIGNLMAFLDLQLTFELNTVGFRLFFMISLATLFLFFAEHLLKATFKRTSHK